MSNSGTPKSNPPRGYTLFYPEPRTYRPQDPGYVNLPETYYGAGTAATLRIPISHRNSQPSQASTAVSSTRPPSSYAPSSYSGTTAVSSSQPPYSYASNSYASSGYLGPSTTPDGRNRQPPQEQPFESSHPRTQSPPRTSGSSRHAPHSSKSSYASSTTIRPPVASAYTPTASPWRGEEQYEDDKRTVLPSDSVSQIIPRQSRSHRHRHGSNTSSRR